MYNYTASNASLFGSLFIIGGIVGSACFATFVQKTRKYKVALNMITILSTAFTVGSFYGLALENVHVYSALCFFSGFSMVSMTAVSFDFGVELTYPVEQSISTGSLSSSGQFFGIIFVLISSD